MQNTISHTAFGSGQATNDTVDALYDGSLDVVVLHDVIADDVLHDFATAFHQQRAAEAWNRPNKPIPPIDLRLLGVGAAPTATTPAGPDRDAYFAAAAPTVDAARALLRHRGDPIELIESGLAALVNVPLALARDQGGQSYAPFTMRAMPGGVGLMVHHDNHLSLDIYAELRPQLDARLQASFFIVLQHPNEGGRICVYAAGPEDDARLPRGERGMLDAQAMNETVAHEYFDVAAGDLFVFASSRLYHRVEPVAGTRDRVTIGGFLGLDARHERCLYWG